jgi:hypothetical protein
MASDDRMIEECGVVFGMKFALEIEYSEKTAPSTTLSDTKLS